MNQFIIFILPESAQIFNLENHKWQSVAIYGEVQFSLHEKKLSDLWERLSEHLNRGNQLASAELLLLYRQDALPHLKGISDALALMQCQNWQIVRLEHYLQAARIEHPTPHNMANLLPYLNTLLAEDVSAWQETQTEYEATMNAMQGDKEKMQQEIQKLQQTIAAMGRSETEFLVSFLPIIYKDFWHRISPSDLALLNHDFCIPSIASPFSEPAEATILTMKKRLYALPQKDQDKLRNFCLQLEHRLQVRPEMKDFLETP